MQATVYFDVQLEDVTTAADASLHLQVNYGGKTLLLLAEPGNAAELKAALDNGTLSSRKGLARLIAGLAVGVPPCYRFDAYLDPSLSRAPELDTFEYYPESYNVNCIGWKNDSNPFGFLAPKGVIPGLQGAFVTDGGEGFELNVPHEFTNLCFGLGSNPVAVLMDFIAHAAKLSSTREYPRADGLSSSSPELETLVGEYLEKLYGRR